MGLRGAATLEEFIDGLTFFARPDDKLELATLAKRALAYQQGRLRDEALASLTRKARGRRTRLRRPGRPQMPRVLQGFGRSRHLEPWRCS
jgi:hypothetical protein